MTNIGVVIPVGPTRPYVEALDLSLYSMRSQTRQPDHIILVDDMAGIQEAAPRVNGLAEKLAWDRVFVYRPAWQIGVVSALNAGMTLMQDEADVVLILPPGDSLLPHGLEALEAAIVGRERTDWWWFPPDRLGGQSVAVVQHLTWRRHGGFRPVADNIDPLSSLMAAVTRDSHGVVGIVPDDPTYGPHLLPARPTEKAWWQWPLGHFDWGRYGP